MASDTTISTVPLAVAFVRLITDLVLFVTNIGPVPGGPGQFLATADGYQRRQSSSDGTVGQIDAPRIPSVPRSPSELRI